MDPLAINENDVPKRCSGRYNLRVFTLPNWSILSKGKQILKAQLGKKEPSAKNKKSIGNNAKTSELSKSQLLAVKKIKKQQSKDPKGGKKGVLKEKIAKMIPMSTPKKGSNSTNGESSSLDSIKLSPIVSKSDVSPVKDLSIKLTKLPTINFDTEKHVSPPKKQKVSTTKSKNIHFQETVQEELKRKMVNGASTCTLKAASVTQVRPPPTSFENSYIEDLSRKLPISITHIPPAKTVNGGTQTPSLDIFPVQKANKNELNSLVNGPKFDILEQSEDFYGFTDEDIPDDISEICDTILDKENVKAELKPIAASDVAASVKHCQTAPMVPGVLKPSNNLPSQTLKATIVPITTSQGVTHNVKLIYGTSYTQLQSLTVAKRMIPGIPLQNLSNYRYVTQPAPIKVLAHKEVQTEPIVRNINYSYLMTGEPPGSRMHSGCIRVTKDPATNMLKYDLFGIRIETLSVMQNHLVQLQIRHQILSCKYIRLSRT